MPTASNPGLRRSADESRRRLELAAIQLFTERGFAGTSTKDIARTSEVAEKLIFRHYGGKEQLFVAAIGGALRESIDNFSARWAHVDRMTYQLRDLIEEFVGELVAFARVHRRAIIDFVSLRASGDPSEYDSPLEGIFEPLEAIAQHEAHRESWTLEEVSQGTRLTVGAVLGAVLMSDLLYSPSTPEPTDAVLVEGLVNFVIRGANIPPTSS